MPSTYPAKLRVWASVVSQGHVATAASGIMVNAAQEIELLERELAEERRSREEAQAFAWKFSDALRRCADLTEKWDHNLISQVNQICREALGEK